jgi:hypothetical protein
VNKALLDTDIYSESADAGQLAETTCVRRGSHDPAGVPDRRSPALTVGPGLIGIRTLWAHSEGRRPSVRHSCGVRRPAHNKYIRAPRDKSRCSKTSSKTVSMATWHQPARDQSPLRLRALVMNGPHRQTGPVLV